MSNLETHIRGRIKNTQFFPSDRFDFIVTFRSNSSRDSMSSAELLLSALLVVEAVVVTGWTIGPAFCFKRFILAHGREFTVYTSSLHAHTSFYPGKAY